MSIQLPEEKLVQLRMWAVDTVLNSSSSEEIMSQVLADAADVVKFVLGES